MHTGDSLTVEELGKLPIAASVRYDGEGKWTITKMPSRRDTLVQEMTTARVKNMTIEQEADWILERFDRKQSALIPYVVDRDGSRWDINDDGVTYRCEGFRIQYQKYTLREIAADFGPIEHNGVDITNDYL